MLLYNIINFWGLKTMTNVTSTPAQPLPVQMQLVPFAQMEQERETQQAIAQSTKSSEGKTDPCNAFKGLMPAWMLAAGSAYATQEEFNSDNGQMGQFLQAVTKVASLSDAFTQAVDSLQSFGALKSWLDALGKNQPAAVQTLANQLRQEIDAFKTNGNTQQVQQEENSENFIITREASSHQQSADSALTTAKNLESQGGDWGSDLNTVGDFVEQMSEGFTKC